MTAACSSSAVSEAEASEALPYTIYFGDGRSETPAEDAPDLVQFFAQQDSPEYGLVLPGFWDASCLRIFLFDVESVNIGGEDYRSGDIVSLPLDETVSVTPDGCDTILLTVRQTGGLPTLFIQTESGSCDAIHADKTYSEPGYMQMTDIDGRILHQQALSAVRIRGNATADCSKKPYQIKLEKSAALVGSNAGKTWILLANALDRSEIRNTLALDLARYCGTFAYTPQTQSVDLYVNHEYMGTYLLTEKVQIQENRVAVYDLEKAIEAMNPDLDFDELEALGQLECQPGARKYRGLPAEPEDYTGGYIVQINAPVRYTSEACGFVSDQGCVFTLQEPKYTSEVQTRYLSNLFQSIENALYSDDGIDPISGMYYSELLDLPSFADRYLVAEVLNDYDGQYSYFYKDTDASDPTVYAGPVWDQDNILGVWGAVIDPTAVHIAGDSETDWVWFAQAAQHTDFSTLITERYRRVFQPAVRILLGLETDPQGVLRSIDEYAREVSVSAQADHFRWTDPRGPRNQYYNFSIGDTFEEQVDYLKDYLTDRQEALDRFFCP